MKRIIAEAKPILPTFKPCGELVPYVGETISQLNEGTDLVLNVAPEGCMVSSLGAILTPKILQSVKNNKALIQYLFSTDGELNEDLLRLSLLKILGPAKYHSH
jgi:predicted nucleotide-binding protein (sugar kinase/HSP70/actin superfamily)